VTEPLAVHINRDRIHAIDVAPSFETTGSFAVVVENHGSPTHVHLHLDDALSRVAHVGTPNHYVEADDTATITVSVREGPRPVEGALEVVTGYGAETARVAVDVTEPSETDLGVAVDEEMEKPPEREVATERSGLPGVPADSVPVLALAGVAIALAFAAVVVSETLAVAVGLLAVVAGVAAAAVFLRRPN